MGRIDYAEAKLEVYFSLRLFGWAEKYLKQELLGDLDKKKAEMEDLRRKLDDAKEVQHAGRHTGSFRQGSYYAPRKCRYPIRVKQNSWGRALAQKSRLASEERILRESIRHSRKIIQTASARLAELRSNHKGIGLGRRSQEFARRVWDATSYEDINTYRCLLAAQLSRLDP